MKKKNAGKPLDRNIPQTIDGATGTAEPTRVINLSNLRDVRLELAHVYRKMDSGELQSQDGTRRAYVLKTIHDVIVSAELEKRIAELEQQHGLTNDRPLLPNAARAH